MLGKIALAVCVVLLGGCAAAPIQAAPGNSPASAPAPQAAVAVSSAAAAASAQPEDDLSQKLDQAESKYKEAVGRLASGDIDGGRQELREAFDAAADGIDDDGLAASLQPEFSGMLDRIRDWQGPQAVGEDASGLDVSLSTASVRIEPIKLDASNPITQKFVEIYTKRRPQTVEQALARSGRYRDMILADLKKAGLPPELLYLVMTESEYKYDAVSHSGAAGLWQFMPATARKYGLEVSYWVDERFDPEKSTRAAVRYLGDLYRWFGDWDLALAAYNRGEGGIGRDLQWSRSTDFDSLADRNALPQETHFYVPKFQACALIGTQPEKYGLHPSYDQPEAYDSVPLPRDLDLGVAAKCAGTSEAVLRRLNPELRAWCTPKDRPGFVLRVPKGTKDEFLANLAKVKDWNPGPTLVRYRVRRGDFLGRIAKLNHTTVRGIMATNKLRSARLIHPGMILLIKPGRASASRHARRRRHHRRRR